MIAMFSFGVSLSPGLLSVIPKIIYQRNDTTFINSNSPFGAESYEVQFRNLFVSGTLFSHGNLFVGAPLSSPVYVRAFVARKNLYVSKYMFC